MKELLIKVAKRQDEQEIRCKKHDILIETLAQQVAKLTDKLSGGAVTSKPNMQPTEMIITFHERI